MFDIGWSEMAVIALLTLIVIGPRELPRVMRTVGQWVRKAQSLAREFQRGLDDMAREADLEDAKKLIDTGRSIANPKKMVMDSLGASDTSDSVAQEFKDLQKAMRADPEDDTTGKALEDKAPEDKPAADEPAKATVVKQPTNVAPPDSVTPPPEPPTQSATKPAAAAKPKSATELKPTTKPASKSETKSKPKPRAKSKAKPGSATAGADGSQKTA